MVVPMAATTAVATTTAVTATTLMTTTVGVAWAAERAGEIDDVPVRAARVHPLPGPHAEAP